MDTLTPATARHLDEGRLLALWLRTSVAHDSAVRAGRREEAAVAQARLAVLDAEIDGREPA